MICIVPLCDRCEKPPHTHVTLTLSLRIQSVSCVVNIRHAFSWYAVNCRHAVLTTTSVPVTVKNRYTSTCLPTLNCTMVCAYSKTPHDSHMLRCMSSATECNRNRQVLYSRVHLNGSALMKLIASPSCAGVRSLKLKLSSFQLCSTVSVKAPSIPLSLVTMSAPKSNTPVISTSAKGKGKKYTPDVPGMIPPVSYTHLTLPTIYSV